MVRRYPVEVDWTLQRHPVWRALALAVLGFLALAAWAISSPAGSSPDDDFHLTSIWCAQGERQILCKNLTTGSADVPENVVHAPCFAYDRNKSAACQNELTTVLIATSRLNNVEHSYPGGFYWAMSLFAGPNVAQSVVIMRLVNSALFIMLAAASMLLITPRWRKRLALTIAVTIVPLGMFIIPSTNPSSWTLYAPVFVYLLTRTMIRLTSQKWLVLTFAVTLAIAAISSAARSDAAIFAVFAVVLGGLSERKSWFRKPAYYALAAFTVAIALWCLAAGGQVAGANAGLDSSTAGSPSSGFGLLLRNITDLPGLIFGSLGSSNLGWLDTPMPSAVWVLQLLTLGALLMNAIILKKSVRELISPAVACFALVSVPIFISMRAGASIGAFVQPRYVLPLLALFVVSLITTRSTQVVYEPIQISITLIAIAIANVIAISANALRYSLGTTQSAQLFSSTSSAGMVVPIIIETIASALIVSILIPVFKSSNSEIASTSHSLH